MLQGERLSWRNRMTLSQVPEVELDTPGPWRGAGLLEDYTIVFKMHRFPTHWVTFPTGIQVVHNQAWTGRSSRQRIVQLPLARMFFIKKVVLIYKVLSLRPQRRKWWINVSNPKKRSFRVLKMWVERTNDLILTIYVKQGHITCKLDPKKWISPILSCQKVYVENCSTKGPSGKCWRFSFSFR